jgi:hypothetical protein
MQQEDDLSFSIRDFTPEVDASDATPASHSDRVLQRLRTVYPRMLTRQDLNSDPLVGGKVAATKKALQRLAKRGLLEVAEEVAGIGSPPIHMYRAVLFISSTTRGRGETDLVSSTGQIASAGTEVDGDTLCPLLEGVPDPTGAEDSRGHIADEDTACLHAKTSAGAESSSGGHSGEYPHARLEVNKLALDAAATWEE